jgi:hypothetical protein
MGVLCLNSDYLSTPSQVPDFRQQKRVLAIKRLHPFLPFLAQLAIVWVSCELPDVPRFRSHPASPRERPHSSAGSANHFSLDSLAGEPRPSPIHNSFLFTSLDYFLSSTTFGHSPLPILSAYVLRQCEVTAKSTPSSVMACLPPNAAYATETGLNLPALRLFLNGCIMP